MIELPGQTFLEECLALNGLVSRLDSAAFARVTDFYGWTVHDEVMHLMFLDEITLLSIENESGFLELLAEIRAYQRDKGELSQFMRERYAAMDRDGLVARWQSGFEALAVRLAASDPKARMKWFGPDMSIVSAASARQMEVWAHGQDLYDLFGEYRRNADRIRNICELGVRTFGWSFFNRGLAVPAAPPELALMAPSGNRWLWNEGAAGGRISGSAEDFAAIVTQRRNLADTALSVTGATALHWMEIAQCFAGAPSDGPPPGRMPLARMEARHEV
jgi:uncharacterized protein (TIGR03084 family)